MPRGGIRIGAGRPKGQGKFGEKTNWKLRFARIAVRSRVETFCSASWRHVSFEQIRLTNQKTSLISLCEIYYKWFSTTNRNQAI